VVCGHEALYDLAHRNGHSEKVLMLAVDMSLFHICSCNASLRLKNEDLVYAAHQTLGRIKRRQTVQCVNLWGVS
jgi:hypothetical protein